jgi:hypothetical protein
MPAPEIHSILASLAARRPVFHSEADFQHALAWELQLADPGANIRLEKQVAAEGARVHLDLLVQGIGYEFAIELKYKTRAAKLNHGEEEYPLRDQSAQDIGRHDFIKDIQRLEKYVVAHPSAVGFAILLTNDRTYWSESRKIDSVDSEFRVHEGRVIRGEVTWGEVTWGARASAGTKHKREQVIALRGDHAISWRDYSLFGDGRAEKFRYVVLQVRSDG